MRYTTLLVIAALLVSVSSAFTVPDSTTTYKIQRTFRPATTIASKINTSQSEITEERMFSSEKIKSLFTPSKVSDVTLQRWLKNKKSVDSVFVRLHLTSAKGDIFENPQFATWVKYADELNTKSSTKSESIIATLTRHYGNQALSQKIIAAQNIPRTNAFATEVQTRQLKYWLDDKKTPAEVYKLLMLEKAGDNLLESPQFATWISYADKFNVKIPRKSQSEISVLTKYYGDEGLSKMLLTAERSPQKSSIVRKLQAEQFYHWLTTKTTPSDVFVFLMLNKAGDKLLDNPQFSAWITYLDDFNKKNPENKMPIVSVLKDYYNNEKLEKMLEVVKPLPTSEKIVKRLGTEQKWMNKETPDKFFKGLKLDQVGVNVFSSPQLKKWINYMKAYNKDNPKYQTTLIATLAKYYGSRKLVQMINAAKNVESTAPFAKRLESEQFQVWLKNQWTPGDIFKLMNLDDLDDKLFSSPAFVTWTKYLSVFNMENPTKKTTLLATLTPNYYSEKRVVQLLTRATTIPSTESIAAKLHAELYQHWLAMMKPPASVFTMLNLHTEGSKLFTTPQFRTWLQYNDDFAIKAVSKEDIATDSLKTTLTGFYETSALTRMVETAMKDPSTKTIATRVNGELLNNTT